MNEFKAELTLENISDVSEKLLLHFSGEKVFLLDAPMGAGKTTFVKELCRALGSADNFSSPTYSIVNEYKYPEGKIYHFDLYRLKNEEELFDMGFDEYLNSGHYCFIEWPGISKNLVDTDCVKIDISTIGNNRYLHAAKI